MMAMMNNPNKWAERHKRDYRRRFVKVVATIVLTCSLPFGVLTVASPTVRAAVIDWVVEWYESSIIYKFFGESDSTKLPLYEVIDLPFDYTRIARIFCGHYERPGVPKISERVANAKKWYNFL